MRCSSTAECTETFGFMLQMAGGAIVSCTFLGISRFLHTNVFENKDER